MKKYNITIKFNDSRSKECIETYQYTYDKKLVIVKMYENAFVVEFAVTKSFANYKRFEYIFVDIIKKIYLIHTIYFNKLFNNEYISFYVDGELQHIMDFKENEKIVYSLFENLKDNITDKLKSKDIIEKIISYPKSKYDNKIASLFAYICAKSKIYESDRLQFYWMSLNGFYNRYQEDIKSYSKDGKLIKPSDNLLINQLLLKYRLRNKKDMFGENDRSNSVLKVAPALREIAKTSYSSCKKVTKHDIDTISDKIKNILQKLGIKKAMDPYGYVLTQIPYYYRCNMFHGSKPITLFPTVYEDSNSALKVANDIMEEFLDNHIVELFQ